MVSWIVFAVALLAVVVGGVVLLRRLTRWHDPSLDSQEKQAEAFMWSQRSGSGGWGS